MPLTKELILYLEEYSTVNTSTLFFAEQNRMIAVSVNGVHVGKTNDSTEDLHTVVQIPISVSKGLGVVNVIHSNTAYIPLTRLFTTPDGTFSIPANQHKIRIKLRSNDIDGG